MEVIRCTTSRKTVEYLNTHTQKCILMIHTYYREHNFFLITTKSTNKRTLLELDSYFNTLNFTHFEPHWPAIREYIFA
jgi:hypothetical protein